MESTKELYEKRFSLIKEKRPDWDDAQIKEILDKIYNKPPSVESLLLQLEEMYTPITEKSYKKWPGKSC